MKSGLVFSALTFIIILNCQCTSKEVKSGKPVADSIYVNISRMECRADTSHSYYIALPDAFTTTENYPLIIAFDPKGDGDLAVRSLMGGVTNFGYIVAGSNVIRNGYENVEYAFNILTSDILNRYPVNKDRIYAAGFSGGGRYAQIFSQINTNTRAIISIGAGFSFNPPQVLLNKVPMLFLIGYEDFNYLEVINSEKVLKQSGIQYYILEFNGKHAWPDPEVMTEALLWFELDDCRRDKSRRNDPIIKSYQEKINENASRFMMDQDVFSAYKEHEKGIAMLTGLTDIRSQIRDMNQCKESPDYKSASDKKNKSLILESRLQQGYISALNRKDTLWWRHEIRNLDQKIIQTEDPYMLSTYIRVKNFISVAAYSLTNQSLKDNDLPRAIRIIDIYQIIDPENPDGYYFRAAYYSKTGQSQMAVGFYKKAIDSGFNDFGKARQELPENIYETALAE